MAQPIRKQSERADSVQAPGRAIPGGARPGRSSRARERQNPPGDGGQTLPVVSSKAPIGWDNVIFTHIVVLGVPTILYYYLRQGGSSLFELHVGVATIYLITALMIFYEATVALFRRFAGSSSEPTDAKDQLGRQVKSLMGLSGARVPQPTRPVPRSTLIVAAYLPNEQDIILETLEHILTNVRRPEAGLEVILAYNTPIRLPIEDKLKALAEKQPDFKLLRVEGSESKAENLNAGIDIATGEIVGILDSDHHPPADCFERAWRWLEGHYDVVQGRNVIRNRDVNFLTKMISVEFECMYGVSHPARSLFVDTAIFGGSNGYWRIEALRQTKFDPNFMTEDIDASSRALLAGLKIMADRSIVSTELAPLDFRSLWFQRKRWAQGWLEVTLQYQRSFWKSKVLTFWQRLYWTYLLLYRELYPPITLQIIPIVISLLMLEGRVPLTAHWYLWGTAVVTLASGPFQTLVAMKNAFLRFSLWTALQYSLSVFFYVIIKNMISIVAVYDHLMRRTDWVITRREMSEKMQQFEGSRS